MKTILCRLACLLMLLPTVAFGQWSDGDAKAHFSHPLEFRVATQLLSSEREPVWAASVIDGLRVLPNVTLSQPGRCDYLLVLTISPAQGGYTCMGTVLLDAKPLVSASMPSKAWAGLQKASLVRLEDLVPVNAILERAAICTMPCFILGGNVLGSGSSPQQAIAQCLGRFNADFLVVERKGDKEMRDAWNSNHPASR